MCPDSCSATDVRIDAEFPGGNIRVEALGDGQAALRQDQRDTARWWFHWAFRVRGAAGQRWRFSFVDGDVIGTRGPACSLDGGETWFWLGREVVTATPEGVSFEYLFPATADEVRFAFAMPYLQRNLEAFQRSHAALDREVLCTSRKGRPVELLRLPCRREPEWRVLLIARHHCCESVANWVLEGILEAVLAPTAVGGWFRQHAAFLVVPFVDKDGVEDGDQGKGRQPHDHGRDYAADRPAVYPETGALRERISQWAAAGPMAVLDLHCPWIRGPWNEQVYMVGSSVPRNAHAQQRLARFLAATHRGEWDFRETDFLPFGESWNTADNTVDGETCCRFAARQPNIRLATTFEIPYATVRDATVSPEAARAFGHSLAAALRVFLASTE
jgi:hypothetical protein